MIDPELIRKDPEGVAAAFKKRLVNVDFSEFLATDRELRNLNTEVERLRERRNKGSAEMPNLLKQGGDISGVQEEMRQVGEQLKEWEVRASELEALSFNFLSSLPNLPADDVVAGGKEQNVVVRTYGEKPSFDFIPKDHVELCTDLGLIDYTRGAKLGGKGFWVYTNDGAVLEWALLNYFIDSHRKAGFEFVLVPHILTYEGGFVAGQFPKFVDDVFGLRGEQSAPTESMQFLIPTAETALANLHRGEILPEAELPKRYFSYTPCFRKEAGGYGASERGMIRGHQFNKVELFVYCKPADSDRLLEDLIQQGESLMKGLGLHYQVSKLAAADCSASMAKTYDIEVWIPSMSVYKEVSSASNGGDFQARRGKMRYKDTTVGKNLLMHTLNASGLATSRLVPAIVEQYQLADGRVQVPKVLQPFVGKEFLARK